MTRIIIHAGFYKTGTTSFQRYFEQNATLFESKFHYCSKAQLSEAAIAAREFGTRPFWWRLRAFRRAFEELVTTLPDADVIVLSREQFSGAMPGFKTIFGRRITSNATAGLPLAKEMSRALRRRFGENASIEFLFTLREGEAWVKSLYGHVQRSKNMTQDFAAFRNSFPKNIDLLSEAASIAQAAMADEFHTSFLEATSTHPLGPAKALIDLLALPTDFCEKLPPARHENKGSCQKTRDAS